MLRKTEDDPELGRNEIGRNAVVVGLELTMECAQSIIASRYLLRSFFLDFLRYPHNCSQLDLLPSYVVCLNRCLRHIVKKTFQFFLEYIYDIERNHKIIILILYIV